MLKSMMKQLAVAGLTLRNICIALGVASVALSVPLLDAQTPVSLSPSATPASAQPLVQSVRLTVNQLPAGTILASGITVSLAPVTAGAGPSVQVVPSGFARLFGSTGTVTFTVPASLTLATPVSYLATVAGSVQGGTTFASTNTANLLLNPPAQVTVLPGSGQQGQSLSVTLQGTYSHFYQGVTTANFGPGISVGGAAASTPGPVTVTSPTSATAQLVIAANATPGSAPFAVITALEQATSSFTVTAAAAQPIDLSIFKSHTGNFTQGQNGSYSVVVSNAGPGATSGTVTVADTLPSGLSLVSMSGAGWSCTGATCTRSDVLSAASSYPAITLTVAVAASAPASVVNAVSVSGGGTDSNPANNSTTDTATVLQVPASVTATGGTPQSAAISTAYASPLQVVVKDSGGNPLSGVNVTFTAPATGSSGLFANSTTSITVATNASGIASAGFTANATAGGPYGVTASVSGVSPSANFSLTNTAGTAASVTATLGTPQSAAISTAFASPLQVVVKDAGGNPLSGVNVTFTAPASGASGLFANSTTSITVATNASGIASAGFTANATAGGPYSITASVAGVATPATFSLTNTVGAPASIAASAGTPQSAPIGTAFGVPLQVVVKDAGQNPVSGVTVTFSAPGSGASGSFSGGVTAVTGSNGVATAPTFTANQTAGSYTVTATASGIAGPAAFALTNTSGAPASIAIQSGTPQSAVINTAFGAALQVVVKDSGNNPLSGVTVTFSLPATGASATIAGGNTAVTNASGIAISGTITANGTVGTYTAAASVSGVAAPANFSLTNTVGAAASVTATAGTPQSTIISTAFTTALQVVVKDAGGNPVSGVTVTFAAPASGASGGFASGNTVTTNASGIATASTFTANSTAGSYVVTSSVSGIATPASFSLTNTVGAPASVTATAGTPQSTIISTAFGSPLQVVVKDAGGNPVLGVTVTFAAPASGASATFASGVTAVTNASGVASSSALTANSTAGSYSITSSVSGVAAPATFSLTNTPGAAASITATSGTPQNTVISTAFASTLQATVKDAGGNAVPNVIVTFTAPSAGASGSFASGNTAVTNANGIATSGIFTANSTAGGYSVTASAPGLATMASFSLTNTPGAAASITVVSGTPQSTQINTAFASSLQVVVKDAGSNPVSGVTVTFSVPSSGASATAGSYTAITNTNGVATSGIFTANSTAGGYSVTASASGVGTTASFSLTNTAGAASSITILSGTPQSAQINTAFASPLQVVVRDSGSNPVSGVTVTFTVPSSGASATAASYTAVTGTDGIATSSTFTANSIAGTYNVTASAPSVGGHNFLLTNLSGVAASITAISGTGQSTIINTAFSNPLQVVVRDSGSNPVSGATVTFTVPATGASATFTGGVTTATTGSNGVATSPVITANATAGGYTVTTSVSGVSTSASFSLTNTPGVPVTVTPYSGTPQSAPVGTAYASNLQVLVRDSGNNGVSGVTVTFAAPTSGATGSFAGGVTTATTNSSGIATAPVFTANTTAGSYQVTASVSGVATAAVFTLTNTQAIISTISPTSGTLAQTLNVTITGASSHFVQGTTTAYFGTGITVNSVTVSNSTSAIVNITIAPTTALGYRNVTLTTGSEVATYTNGFYVQQGSAVIASLTPASGAQGTQASVAIVGTNTNFQQGTTTAYFGQNVGINSVTVTDLTHASVNITIGGNATLGVQTVSLTTGGEVASITNGFTITAGLAQITTVNPGSGNQGDTADTIAITGQATHFVQGTSTASFGAGITVTSLTVNSALSATAVISIDPAAAIGNRTVTITTGSEVASSSATAFSVGAGIPSATANPTFGIQGSNPTVVINGSFTSFVQGVTTVSFSDGNISVGTVTVNGPTQLSVPIQINTGAIVGNRTITINTNGHIVTASFHVVAGMPVVTLINPNVGVPNSTLTVHITGNFTNWINGTTQVSFGAGIAVGGGTAGQPGPVTVNNTGDITASIAIATAAAVGPRDVTIATGSEVETVSSGFTVETCTTTPAVNILNSPTTNATNVPLNTIIQVEFNAPIDRTTVNTTDFYLYDTTTSQKIPATVAVDASGRIMTLTPSVLLAVGRQFYAQWGNLGAPNQIKDTCGNLISGQPYFYFTTTFATETAGPTLIAFSPQPIDTPGSNFNVVLKFDQPIDPVTQASGIVVSAAGTPIAGTYTPSPDYTAYTFVPASPLASTAVTVTYTSALLDGAGNALTNPGSFTFTTGAATITTPNTITYTDPYSNETNVSTNIHPTVYFSRVVDPIAINPSYFYLYTQNTSRRIPSTISFSADRLSASLTPLQPLQPNTAYYFSFGYYSVLDLEGNYVNSTTAYFTTANGSATTGARVIGVSPADATTGAPVNTQVVATLSAPFDGGTITNSSITVKAGGIPIAGTVTRGSDNMTLTFVPTANLQTSTTYAVTVGGFLDGNENAVQSFTSTFTTGTSNTGLTANLTVVSTSPTNGATGVANNAPITITFSAAVDPLTINNILVRDQSNSYYEISGTFAVSGSNPAQVIFTPTTPYPASSVIRLDVQSQVTDLAGNGTNYYVGTFTVAANVDTSAFQVVSVSPANNMTGVGRNATIVLTFNKSVDHNSFNNVNALQLFAGDANIYTGGITYSADGRSISFTPNAPPDALVNIEATPLIKDLSGNPLVNFVSKFTTINDITSTAPAVVQMLPASGSSDVLQSTPITLYTNGAPLDPATVTNTSLYVSQNGILVQGTIQVSPGGQSISFLPAAPFSYGALVQVFLEPTVADIYGNALTTFNGQFTIQGNPSTVAPVMIGSSPPANFVGAPVNTLPQMKFDQPLLASSVDSTSVFLYQSCTGTTIPGNAAVIGDGSILQFTPSTTLPATCNGNPSQFYLQINNGTKKVTNLSGVAVAGAPYFYFTLAGATADHTAPTVISIAPPQSSTNIGINAVLYVQFSKVIDTLSVTGATVQVTGGSQTAVPATISFDTTGTIATIQPELPLPANTQMTVTITGVTDLAGNAVTPFTSTFTTGNNAVTNTPQVIYTSVAANATGVPTNAIFSVQFDQPMAPNSFTPATFYLVDNTTAQHVPATITLSADGTTATLTPTSPLLVNRQYYYQVYRARGLSGNFTGSPYWYFTTQSTTSALLPQVIGVNPTNNFTNVPTNTVVQLLFNEPIAPDTVSQVSINQNGTPIAATITFTRNNTLLAITPAQLLLPNTVYTVTASGVVDYAGHAETTPFSATFTTAASSDIMTGAVAPSYIPQGNSTNVALNIHPTFFLTKQVNPLSVYPGIFTLRDQQTNGNIAGTTTVSADQMSITFIPNHNLQPDTQYYLYLNTTYDIAGNYISGTSISFTTGSAATTTGASVVSISPPNNQTAVPLNTQVVAVMSAPVSQNTFGSSAITVKAGSTLVPGTTTLAADEMTLTFTPTANLAPSTAYTVTVGGFSDQNGNTVQTATSTFTTGTTTEAVGSFSVISVTPGNGNTIASNTTPIVLTFNQAVDPATITNVLVRDQTDGYIEVAGSWLVNGATATFTPLSAYPANHIIRIDAQNSVLDYAGVALNYFVSTFTAANIADTTAPTVTSVTPPNGTMGLGEFPPIVLTFSKSMNTSTLNTTSVILFAGDAQASYSLTFPADARSVILHPNALPASSTITISVTSAALDLSGNALVPFQSQFTTGPVLPTQNQAPQVIGQVPGNGTTDIAPSVPITLYTKGTPIDPSTINANSVQVSENGQLVAGTLSVIGDGHAIEFTPSAPLPFGSLVQIFVNTNVMDVDGFPLYSAYNGQFTVQGDPASTAATVTGTNPVASTSGVALNVLPQIRFDQPILASTVTATSAYLTDCTGAHVAGTPSVAGNGTIVQFTPSAALHGPTASCPAASNYFYFYVGGGTTGITNTSGKPINGYQFYFYASAVTDSTHPTVTAIGPPAGSQNVGINASIYLQFSKPINPLSVTGASVTLTGASQTVMPASISFNSTNNIVTIQPATPLPPSTTITITINGVTDPEGNTVTPVTSTFKTAVGPDSTAPTLVTESYTAGGTVPLNTTAFSFTFSKPMDPLSLNPGSFILHDNNQNVNIPAVSITFSSDMMTFTYTVAAQSATPTGPQFNAGDYMYLQAQNALDLTGNSAGSPYAYFYIGATTDAVAPTVLKVNPQANLTNVPTNTQPQIEFSKEISGVSAQMGIQLLQGSTPVPATITLTRGDTVATVTPNAPLAEGTVYTISAAGVQDVQGTPLASTYTSTFTTSSTGISLVAPTVVSLFPANGATAVPTSVNPVVVFSAAMNPLNFDPSLVYAVIENNSNSVVIPAAVSFSSDGKTVTFTPTAALTSATTYKIYISYYYLTDVAGNRLASTSSTTFTTQ